MSTKRILLLVTIACVVAGGWAARSLWRAHKNIVSLHVRNAPLADVVRKLERQSGEPIVVGKELSASVTLDLDSVPLTDALALVAEQAGGLSGAIHTVYRSERELGKLKATLADGRSPEPEIWTNLAPNFGGPDIEPGEGDDADAARGSASVSGRPRIRISSSGELPPGMAVTEDTETSDADGKPRRAMTIRMNGRELKEGDLAKALAEQLGSNAPVNAEALGGAVTSPDGTKRQTRVMTLRLDGTQLKDGDLDHAIRVQFGTNSGVIADAVASAVTGALGGLTNGTGSMPGGMRMHAVSSGPVIMMKRAGPGVRGGEAVSVWSPERIIMEASLLPRLGSNLPEAPTRAEADKVASKVQGRCVTLYALQPAPGGPLPADFLKQFKPMLGGGSHSLRISRGTNGAPDLHRITDEVENRLQRESLEQFQKLTPEQRAERARARANAQTNR